MNNTNTKETLSKLDECQFRDSLLKCLYAKDLQYPRDFKWQIQLRTNLNCMNQLNHSEDLFKVLFLLLN